MLAGVQGILGRSAVGGGSFPEPWLPPLFLPGRSHFSARRSLSGTTLRLGSRRRSGAGNFVCLAKPVGYRRLHFVAMADMNDVNVFGF